MRTKRYPTVLTIAGSDSGGCAGIQADLKAISALGVFATSAITAITSQNTTEVRHIEPLPVKAVRHQIEAVLDDIVVDAIKTGMLPSPAIIEAVASAVDKYRIRTLVVDPVMVTTSGTRLVAPEILDALRGSLYGRLTLLTPNLPEAEVLSGIAIRNENTLREAAEKLLSEGCAAVLIKGGHATSADATDTLFRPDREPVVFSTLRIASPNLHGTGCTFASAIAALLALGHNLEQAIGLAKTYISAAIAAGANIRTGHGAGPVNHFFDPKPLYKL